MHVFICHTRVCSLRCQEGQQWGGGEKTFFCKCCIMASRQVRLTWTRRGSASREDVGIARRPECMSQPRWEFCLCRVREWYCPLIPLITPWRRVLLEKLTVSQLVEKFPAYYRTQSFITAFTKSRRLCLSRARPVQTITLLEGPF